MNWKKLLNSDRIRVSSRVKDARNEFESDFGRIIFSPAVRRMHDKTQVFPLTTDDNIHSRLTHSLEVMSVGYTMGIRLSECTNIQERTGKNENELIRELPLIMKNICLLHDIGNPPFGHFGETVIQEYFENLFDQSIVEENISECRRESAKKRNKLCLSLNDNQQEDFLKFDGNAQGLRVITKLQRLDDLYGLNLTYATLSAFIKYPNNSKIDKNILNKKKRGVFCSEKEYFDKICIACGTKENVDYMRHPLSYLMEAADSICYLAMDIEDGFNKNLFDMSFLYKKLEPLKQITAYDILNKKIAEIENSINDTKKIVSLRIAIIGKLVDDAILEFENNLNAIENNEYNYELIDKKNNKLVEILSSISTKKIFTSREINSLELTGHSVMSGLLDYYIDFLIRKENEKYKRRASCLISGSIVDIAIDENFDAIVVKRKGEYKYDPNQEKFEKINKLDLELKELEKRLNNNLSDKNIDQKLKSKKQELWDEIEPNIDDLNDYYKLRVIVDFISGMTDQFALNHYRKISGQKIN